MKQKSIKLTLMLVAVFMAIGLASEIKAQPTDEEREQYRQIFQELGDMMRNYKQSNIHPQMLEWKEKLDGAMSAEDLRKLNALREEASQHHKEMREIRHEKRKEMREKRRNKDDKRRKGHGPKHGRHGMNKENREEMADIFSELKPLAEKYKETLREIGDEAEPMHDKWREGMEEIKDEWKKKYEAQLEDMKDRKIGKKAKRHFRHHKQMGGDCMGPKAKAAMFMLWDGKIKERMRDSEGDNSMINPLGVDEESYGEAGLRNYPNPFSESTTIYVEMPKEENVSLEIYDNLGKKIGTIYEGKLPEGERLFEFNVNSGNYKGLKSGTYIYKLTAESFSKSGKMVISK